MNRIGVLVRVDPYCVRLGEPAVQKVEAVVSAQKVNYSKGKALDAENRLSLGLFGVKGLRDHFVQFSQLFYHCGRRGLGKPLNGEGRPDNPQKIEFRTP